MPQIGARVATSRPTTCTWCGTHYPRHQRNCTNCGGPLPGPTPPDPGPAPPPAPRTIPRAYVRRLTLTGNVLTIVGGAFVAVGVLVALVPLGIALAAQPEVAPFALIGVLFALIGAPLLGAGLRRARRQLHALRDGVAVRGSILELYRDTSQAINGRHPWAVVYGYEARGRHHEGTVRSWARGGTVAATYAVGSPVHVLYVPEAPDRSALYPPIR